MMPLAVPDLSGNESRYLQECIETNFVSSVGPFVPWFEEMVAAACGTEGTVAVSSGTTGLHTALTAVGVGQNDLVVLPNYTFIASANAISQCGADPWLFDIDMETWTLDPVLLERTLEEHTHYEGEKLLHRATGRRVAALLPVYVFGLPADMDQIASIARRFNLPVVADAAAALGATYKGRKISLTGADLTVFSFNGNKTITAGGGGAIAGNDKDLLGSARHLATTARTGPGYVHDQVGFNYRMTNLQAAVGCAQMERFDKLISRKRNIHNFYKEAFADDYRLRPFPEPDWAESACWITGIAVNNLANAKSIRARLKSVNVSAELFWKPMHLQIPYANCITTNLFKSEDLWQRVVPLPCSTGLRDIDQGTVIAALRDWLR